MSVVSPIAACATQTTELHARADQLLRTEIEFRYSGQFEELSAFEILTPMPADEMFQEETRGPAGQRGNGFVSGLFGIPLLTPAGEVHLFRKFNYLKWQANALRSGLDPDAPQEELIAAIDDFLEQAEGVRNQLAEHNLRLVVSIARRFADTTSALEELLSEGNMILLKAVEKFDYSRGFRFSTYVTHSVQRHFYRFFRVSQRRRSKEQMAEVDFLTDLASTSDDPGESNELDASDFGDLLSQMGDLLDERELWIVRERYGFNTEGKPRTLQVLAKELGVCKERVRQLQNRAVEKLRKLAGELHPEMLLED